MAPREPLVGAALIARFMAAVAQAQPLSNEFESRRVRAMANPPACCEDRPSASPASPSGSPPMRRWR
jgi:hypothetical protein